MFAAASQWKLKKTRCFGVYAWLTTYHQAKKTTFESRGLGPPLLEAGCQNPSPVPVCFFTEHRETGLFKLLLNSQRSKHADRHII